MGTFIAAADLAPFATIDAAKAAAMIEDAEAQAVKAAPCIAEPSLSDANKAFVKSILRGVILRWNDMGTGVKTAMSGLGYSQTLDTSNPRKSLLLWPSEIAELQDICRDGSEGKAFQIDTLGGSAVVHSEVCSLYFGADYCSCGAVLTQGLPLYEQ